MVSDRRWDEAYGRLGAAGASWHQAVPAISLELIDLASSAPDDPVIDVGGGTATLVDQLCARGTHDVSVLDISRTALDASAARCGDAAAGVHWIRDDVLEWNPARRYGIWHDRAVFHFLVDPEHLTRYRQTLRAALRPGGHAVVGTFAPDGPDRCSGLPVSRYDVAGLAEAFGPEFTLVASRREHHTTPSGTNQPFTWVVLRRDEP